MFGTDAMTFHDFSDVNAVSYYFNDQISSIMCFDR